MNPSSSRAVPPAPASPRLSVVVPVLGEAERIGPLLDDLLSQETPFPYEVIVVDGDPAGSTLAAIPHGAVRRLSSPPGRGAQLRAGAEAASGGILLFLHADTRLPAGGLAAAAAAVEGGARAGAFTFSVDAPGCAFRILEAAVALRCRLFRLPYGDQAIFATAEAYHGAGGFPPWPLLEDVELVRRLRRHGASPAILPARALTSGRRWLRDGVLRRAAGNLSILLLHRLGVPPERLAERYR